MNERLKAMAEQSGIEWELNTNWNRPDGWWKFESAELERFAELVRQDERASRGKVLREQDEQIKELQLMHTRLREKFNKSVLDEREACAKLCEEVGDKAKDNDGYTTGGYACAKEIRARGET
jgi:hypothetical protein